MLHVVKTLVAHNSIGFGIGLRRSHFGEILKSSENLPDWFEIISENFMNYGGKPREVLNYLKNQNIPLIAHGVGLSLGSVDPFDQNYLKQLKELIDEYKCPWFTDHLCFSSSFNHQYHDLIPILRNDETLKSIIDKIKYIEDYFQVPFGFENISYYGESSHNTIPEVEFISRILDKTESTLLLDINNIYVNEKNLKIDAKKYIDSLDLNRVGQVHLAGHFDRGDFIIDTHGDSVSDDVWDLYRYFLEKKGQEVSTLIEWDNELPDLNTVLKEALKAKKISHEVFHG